MSHRNALPFLLLLLLTVAPMLTATASADDGWTDLLAGGRLDAWRGYNQEGLPPSWKLDADGALTLSGAGGDLVTRDEFEDFELVFDWKIAAGGNSGVMYLVRETPGPSYETGPEYQLLDDSAHPGSDESQLTGSLYALYTRTSRTTKPAGEWNTARIVVEHGRVEHWLNGVRVVSAQIGSDDWNTRVAGSKFAPWKGFAKSPKGRIALQDHGSEVSFRGLRVRRLAQPQAAGGAARVLFVTQSGGYMHSTVTRQPHELSHAERVLSEVGVRSGEFRVDCTQDVAKDFTPELLANYDVVAFYTTGNLMDEATRLPIPKETLDWFLEDWLAKQGHAFLGIHCAADTYADYQPFWDMIGGSFDGHPWTADTAVVLKVHDGDHPASKPWGAAGTRVPLTDEVYQFKNWQPEKVRVLMSLDMERTELKAPRHVPVLWVKEYGAGRVLHMSLGHREDVWTNPTYQESLIGATRWLLRREPGDATPNPEVSAAEVELAKKAAAAATP